MSKVVDKFGVPLREGDFIVYPQRASSSCWANAARITEVLPDGKLKVEVTELVGRWVEDKGKWVDGRTTRNTRLNGGSHVIRVTGFPQ